MNQKTNKQINDGVALFFNKGYMDQHYLPWSITMYTIWIDNYMATVKLDYG